MLGLFKKKHPLKAVVDGRCIPLEEVADPAFSGKALGDGVAFRPTDGTVVAPCDGTITLLPTTKHAFVVQADDGTQVLIHMGIDTVELKGEGFETHVSQGARVREGQSIVTFDLPTLTDKGFDMTVMMVLLDAEGTQIEKPALGSPVARGTDTAIVYR